MTGTTRYVRCWSEMTNREDIRSLLGLLLRISILVFPTLEILVDFVERLTHGAQGADEVVHGIIRLHKSRL